MENSFNIREHGPINGDQCSAYFIDVSPSATVGDVIKDILSNKNEWGSICIERKIGEIMTIRLNTNMVNY